MIDLASVSASLSVALASGFLIGLEREQAEGSGDVDGETFGGARTFPLLSLVGALATIVGAEVGVWMVGVAFVGVDRTLGFSPTHHIERGPHSCRSQPTAELTLSRVV